MLDQCHNVEGKIPGQIRSVLNVQEMTARALLVDTAALEAAQNAGDVLAANAVLMDAFYTDVRTDLAQWRESRGLPADPMAAFAASGYQEKINADRQGGHQAGWGA
jgi:L-rhamnose isomerase/sugar isomerase